MLRQFFFLLFYFTGLLPINSIQTQEKTVANLRWKIAAELPASSSQTKPLGFAGPIAGENNNVFIVAGGSNFPDSMPWLGGKKKYYDHLFVYIKKGNKLVLQNNSKKLPSAIAYAASCSTPLGVLYAGGENEKGISNKVFLLQWNDASANIVIEEMPDLPIAITNASAAVMTNIVFVAGGETAEGVSDNFFSLDLMNKERGWNKLPLLPKPVSHAVLTANSVGRNEIVYLIGGRKKNKNGISDLYSAVFGFDLKKNQWEEKKSLPYPLSASTGVSSGANDVVLFGGDKGTTFHKSEELMAAINNEQDPIEKKNLIQQRIKLQSTHPGFSHDVLLYNTVKDEWKVVDEIPFDPPVTTTAVKWNKDVFIPGGEIRAGIRTSHIIWTKIKGKAK